MKYLFTLLLFAMGLSSQAQIPGYQGLRFIAKYNCGISHPAMFGRTGKLPSVTHHGSIDYVMSRAWVLGIDYAFMTYKTPGHRGLLNQDYAVSKEYSGRYTQHVVSFTGKYFFKRKGFIAPVGPYINIGGYYQYCNMYFYKANDYNNSVVTYNKATSHYGGAVFGMGRNFVVAQRLIIDLGFTFNVTLPPPTVLVAEETETNMVLYRDLVLRNLFQLHLGLGVLAF